MNYFAYFYFMNIEKEDRINQIAGSHSEYWKDKKLSKYLGGPFSDHTGGLIIFKVENIQEAEYLVSRDPFVVNHLLKEMWVKEWIVSEN